MNKKAIHTSEINVVSAFSRIANAVADLNQHDLTKLADDSYEIEIRFVRKRQKIDLPVAVESDLNDIIELLAAFKSRDEALLFVAKTFETKKNLEILCRQLDIPILKSDKIETLRDKIVEATAGSRIRSEAIQGKGDMRDK